MGKPIPYTVRRKIFAVLTESDASAVLPALSIPGYRTCHIRRCVRALLKTHHLFETFSAKPGKSFISMTLPSSRIALPVNRPNT